MMCWQHFLASAKHQLASTVHPIDDRPEVIQRQATATTRIASMTRTTRISASVGMLAFLWLTIIVTVWEQPPIVLQVDAFQRMMIQTTTMTKKTRRTMTTTGPATSAIQCNGSKRSSTVSLFSSPGEDESVSPTTSPSVDDPISASSSYPIDLPSPLLLAGSMILAIVGTGSVFDLANDSPRWGFGITASLATVSLTLCAGLFWASILKAQAETEADDELYMKGK